MHKFFEEIGLFVWAVIAHWQSYVTGGVVTAIVTLFERKLNKTLVWKYYAIIFLASAGLVAVFYAWHDEHQNAQILINEKAEVYNKLGACSSDLTIAKGRADFFDTQNRQQQTLISDQQRLLSSQQLTMNTSQQAMNAQQGSMNSCVVALGKANTPETQKIDVAFFKANTDFKAEHVTFMMVFTNKIIPSPAKGVFVCEKPVKKVNFGTAGTAMTSDGGLQQERLLEWQLLSPQWTPTNPLIFTIYYDGEDLGRCGIQLR